MSRAFGPRVPRDISAGAGPWFVQIWGIRNSYTWQDLKDHVRPAASHVGHVAVYANGRATITVRKLDEAVACFERLSLHPFDDRQLYVELWETTPKHAPRLIWKNVEKMPSANNTTNKATYPQINQLVPPLVPTQQQMMAQQMASMRLTGEQQQQISPTYQVAYQTTRYPPSSIPQAPPSLVSNSTVSSYMSVVPSLQVPRTVVSYTVARAAPAPMTQGPRYATSVSGMPTNVDRGAIRTEYRGVFVSNLSYDVQDKDLRKLFGAFGEITKIDHKREFKTNSRGKSVSRSRGNAVITFASSDHAKHAIDRLDGFVWDDRPLVVRFDTEATPVDPPARRGKRSTTDGGPLIVDGSTCSE